MANTFKNAWSLNVDHSAVTDVLTVGSSNQDAVIVIGLQLTNTASSEITATITLFDSSASQSPSDLRSIVLLNSVPIPANSMLSVLGGDKIVLEAGDKPQVQSSTATSCNAFVNYLLIDNT